MDIIPDDGMVTLTRKFTGSRSISRINGETVNTGKLKEAAELLIDIHGQHDNKTLLQRKNHLVLLDLLGEKRLLRSNQKCQNVIKNIGRSVKGGRNFFK